MTTESKKLQTALSDLDLDGLTGDTFSLVHDSRIAHEQREAISRLSAALDAAMASMARLNATDGAHKTTWNEGIAARAAAAPYIQD